MQRFIDNGNGTVTDSETWLMWQQATAPVTHTWEEAVQYCKNLNLAGYSDWRLPTKEELQSIVDYELFEPAIDPVFSAESSWHWSSSTFVDFPASAWYVYFGYGYVGGDYNASGVCVRAVRG